MIALATADDRIAAAGEYVLGTLDADDRTAFESAARQDARLHAEVYRWQDRLLGLVYGVGPQPAGAALWARIDVSLPEAPAATSTRPASAPRTRRWPRLPALAFAAFGAVMLAFALFLRVATPEPVRYVALLQSPQDRSTGWVVEVVAGRQVRLRPAGSGAATPVPPGRALQFWTKAEGAAGPTSLGLVQPGEPLELPAARLPAVGERQLFEITLEPAGGSTIGRPTGPILYVGTSVRL